MYLSRAEVKTPKAGRYLAQLCKHFAHKITVDWTPDSGVAEFGMGMCRMRCAEDVLFLSCEAETQEGLEKVLYIVDDHLSRFAWKEGIKADWRTEA